MIFSQIIVQRNNRAKTGAVWGVQDTREQVGFAGLKGK
jgi:hypothetical protein